MKKAKFQRVVALALALVLLVCGGAFGVSANDGKSTTDTNIEEIKELLNAISYNDYIGAYADVKRATGTLAMAGADAV